MTPESDAEKIARLDRELRERDAMIAELGRTVEHLRRELEEWKRGHRVRDRKRRARQTKAVKAGSEGEASSPDGVRRKSGRAKGHQGAGRPGPTTSTTSYPAAPRARVHAGER